MLPRSNTTLLKRKAHHFHLIDINDQISIDFLFFWLLNSRPYFNPLLKW
ncbi:hypothetical protein Psefu_2200 [Pseudomonas fulva 12-X]|uniref:Uncharacterized protein n=1 Tax=Pseudomonas fulva (strain 12-X) TaxID=743720 RepID=F6ABH5_PSEF1|nr:hypothetical protein Psefu_2200 [Pseudomonas fulva 12-X]